MTTVRKRGREGKGGKEPTQFYSLRGETELDRVRGGRGEGERGGGGRKGATVVRYINTEESRRQTHKTLQRIER